MTATATATRCFAAYARVSDRQGRPSSVVPLAAQGDRAEGWRARRVGDVLVRGPRERRAPTVQAGPRSRTKPATRSPAASMACSSTARRGWHATGCSHPQFERELRKVSIEYAVGGADTSTAEGSLMLAIQQAFDEFERDKLIRETRRGQREGASQGWRQGGRAPYGYRRVETPTPEQLVLRFFAEQVFGPLRLQKLSNQLRNLHHDNALASGSWRRPNCARRSPTATAASRSRSRPSSPAGSPSNCCKRESRS